MVFDDNIAHIYKHLANDYARKVYANRLLYSLTGDTVYIKKVINSTIEGMEFSSKLKSSNNILIFGTGTWGKEIISTYSDVSFVGFVDNNAKGDKFCGLPVFTFADYINNYSDSTIIIGTRLYYREIYNQLVSNGIDLKNIVNAGWMIDEMSKRQYFDLPELRNYEKEHEIFVDCGSFDGKTSMFFADWHGNKKGTIYAFEPEDKNFKLCKKNLDSMDTGGGI